MSNWSKSVGTRPNTVRVFERGDRPGLYIEFHERKESLGHSDQSRAVEEAKKKHAELILGGGERPEFVTLEALLGQYRRRESAGKARPKEDERRAELLTRFLGPGKDPHRISRPEWDALIETRRSGEIDARGNLVESDSRRPVGDRTVAADLKFLKAVLSWGVRYGLLRENVVGSFKVPVEKNPRRETADRERYEATLAVARRVSDALPTLLTLAVETGRRIGAIRQLRAEDLRLERTRQHPHGAIRWPAETDKIGREAIVPLSPGGREASDRWLAERPILGRACLFPAPKDPEKPVSRYQADRWLRRAEKLAGLEPLDGTLWHAYRRMFAIEMKHLPLHDVAFLGGWKSVETLMRIYQQADHETVLRAFDERRELRHAL